VGRELPFLDLPDQDGNHRSSQDFLGKKMVIAFFPGEFSGVCTHEMRMLRDSSKTYVRLNAQVVAITVNDPWVNKAFAETNKIPFPILSDHSMETIRRFNIVQSTTQLAKRSVFITDENGILQYSWRTLDPGREPDYEEVNEVLVRLEKRTETVSTPRVKFCSNPECRTEGRRTELPLWANFCDRCGTNQVKS